RFRVALLVGEWAFAVVGIAALWLLPRPAHAVMVGLYLGMGWLATAGLWHYWKATGWRGMAWAMTGAAFYTGGGRHRIGKLAGPVAGSDPVARATAHLRHRRYRVPPGVYCPVCAPIPGARVATGAKS